MSGTNVEMWKKYFQQGSGNDDANISHGSSSTSYLTTGPEIINSRAKARLGKHIKGKGIRKYARRKVKRRKKHIKAVSLLIGKRRKHKKKD